MQGLSSWFDTVFDVLLEDDEAACALVTAARPVLGRSRISLIEDDLSVEEALSYARVLAELGQAGAARDILWQVLFGALNVPQGGQEPTVLHGPLLAQG